MAINQYVGIITDLKFDGPLTKKDGTGQFYKQHLTLQDHTTGQQTTYSGLLNDLNVNYQIGEQVQVTTTTNGQYTNISKVESLNNLNTTHQPVAQPSPLTVSPTQHKTPYKKFNKEKTPYNSDGARIGGIYHDATAAAIHNAKISKREVTVEEITELARTMLEQVNSLEQKKEVKTPEESTPW